MQSWSCLLAAGRGEGNDWSEGSPLCGRVQGLTVQLGHGGVERLAQFMDHFQKARK